MQNVIEKVRKKPRVLDFASDSSDDDVSAMIVTKLRADFDESDDESMGSDEDDVLCHASIYTIDESLKLSIEKMEKIKKLYEMQAQHLNYFLKERRRKYLVDLRKEREMHCSIHEQAKNTAKERALYAKLKLLTRYHRRHGEEAVLYRKYKEKRARSYDAQKTPSHPKCVFTEGGVKCGERTIPCSKYCRKHILEDKKQTLFRACRVEKSNVICHEPTICIGEDSNCLLHLFIPPKQQYTLKKNDSETEDEDLTSKFEGKTSATLSTMNPTTKILSGAVGDDTILRSADKTIIKSTANVEVVPINPTLLTQKRIQNETKNSLESKIQQQETITKVLHNQKSTIRRRSNNRRKPWTTKPRKRQIPQQKDEQTQKKDDGKKLFKILKQPQSNQSMNASTQNSKTILALSSPTIATTKKVTTMTSETITRLQSIVKKQQTEASQQQEQQHQSSALLQQQQQIEKQLQKQQVQQSPPQIFQIQKQVQQQQQLHQVVIKQHQIVKPNTTNLQQQQKLPIKPVTILPTQLIQQQKNLPLSNVKHIISLQQLQQLQQQQQQIQKNQQPTNVKQFITLPQKQQTSVHLRVSFQTTRTIGLQQNQQQLENLVARKDRLDQSSQQQQKPQSSTTQQLPIGKGVVQQIGQQRPILQNQLQDQKLKQQVIQLPLHRTTKFIFQQAPITAVSRAAVTATTSSGVTGTATSSNITYHTIPGLPKSTSVTINKNFVPKVTPVLPLQQKQIQVQTSSKLLNTKTTYR